MGYPKTKGARFAERPKSGQSTDYGLGWIPKASERSVFCSISWAVWDPVAGTRCRGPLHRTHRAPAGQALQSRQHERQRSHVPRLFLHPDELAHISGSDPFPPKAPLPGMDKAVPQRRSPSTYRCASFSPSSNSCPIFPVHSKHPRGRNLALIGNHGFETSGRESQRAETMPPDAATCSWA